MPARKSAKQWNAGMTGESKKPLRSPAVESCSTLGCGLVAAAELPPRRWVRTLVAGSTEPGRDWCSGRCATVGIALAELRMAPE